MILRLPRCFLWTLKNNLSPCSIASFVQISIDCSFTETFSFHTVPCSRYFSKVSWTAFTFQPALTCSKFLMETLVCGICSKLTIKTPKQLQWCRCGFFIVNFEQISHIVLVFPLLTKNKQMSARIMSCCYSEKIHIIPRKYHDGAFLIKICSLY